MLVKGGTGVSVSTVPTKYSLYETSFIEKYYSGMNNIKNWNYILKKKYLVG